MATEEQVADARRMADEPVGGAYTDDELSGLIDRLGSVEQAVARVWQEKASGYAGLVNTSESGSSRNMGDLHRNALRMAEYYGGLVQPVNPVVPEEDRAYTVEITR